MGIDAGESIKARSSESRARVHSESPISWSDDSPRLDRARPAEEMDDQRDHGEKKEQVNQATGYMKH
jgi:hypothetical protein